MRLAALLSCLAFVVGVPVLLASCSSADQNKPVASEASTTTSTSALASAAPAPTTADSDYRISPRDILDVSVFQVTDLTRTVQVSDDGNITLPLIGMVPVKGKTAHDASDEIAARLSKKYLQSPQVSVFVKQYGQRVTISGEVKQPRVLNVEGNLTLTQAIAYAGGLSDLADVKRVHIARATSGHVKDEVYNVADIQSGKAPDPSLQGGDLIVAEQSGVQVVIKNLKDMLPFAVLASLI